MTRRYGWTALYPYWNDNFTGSQFSASAHSGREAKQGSAQDAQKEEGSNLPSAGGASCPDHIGKQAEQAGSLFNLLNSIQEQVRG